MSGFLRFVNVAICAAGCSLGATAAYADRDASNVTVSSLTLGKTTGNYVFIRVSAAPTGQTSCYNVNSFWHFTLSLDDATGKNMYALLLVAAASKQSVNLSGIGLCNEFSGVESLRAVGATY